MVKADDKLAARLDCPSGTEANSVILERITPVEGIVQTNVVAGVRPARK